MNVCVTLNELFTTLIVPCSSYFFYILVGENEGDPLISLYTWASTKLTQENNFSDTEADK